MTIAPNLPIPPKRTFLDSIKAIYSKIFPPKLTLLEKRINKIAKEYDLLIQGSYDQAKYSGTNDEFLKQLTILRESYRNYLGAEIYLVKQVKSDLSTSEIILATLPWVLSKLNYSAMYTGSLEKRIDEYLNTDNKVTASVKRFFDFIISINSTLDPNFTNAISARFTLSMHNMVNHLLTEDSFEEKQGKANYIRCLSHYPWIPMFVVGSKDIEVQVKDELGQAQ